MNPPNGVYAVCVGPNISEEPIRWLFVNEEDADDFAEAIGSGASVTFEPIATHISDSSLVEAYPQEVVDVLAKRIRDGRLAC